MMDMPAIDLFVSQTLPILQPYLPLIAAKAAEKIGSELPAAVGKLWQAIHQKFEGKEAAREAVADLLKDPQNADVQAAFRLQLKKALAEDAQFGANFQELLSAAQAVAPQATVTGDGVIVQGDGNITAGPGGVISFGDVEGGITPSGRPPRRK
jgi:hypothetical protein